MSLLKQNVVPFPQRRASRKPPAATRQELHDADMVAGMKFLGVLDHFECVLLAAIAQHKKRNTASVHKKLVS